jgi:nicotinic acid mononucleotide adenylyltransferase
MEEQQKRRGVPTTKLCATVDPMKVPVVLVTTGSFSPVHNSHTGMFTAAKKFLETQTHRKRGKPFQVVGGYISPKNDEYTRRKYGLDWIPIQHRLKMLDLALEDFDWVMASSWECTRERAHSRNTVMRHIQKRLRKYYHPEVEVFYLCGADLLPGTPLFPVVGLARAGDNITAYKSDPNIYLVEGWQANDVSATKARELLSRGQETDMVQTLDSLIK